MQGMQGIKLMKGMPVENGSEQVVEYIQNQFTSCSWKARFMYL